LKNDKATNKVYATLKDFEGLIEQLDKICDNPSFKFKLHPTEKYMQIKCTKCSLFSYWYKNQNDTNVGDFYNSEGKNKCGMLKDKNAKLNLVFFRGINQNHDAV
jgi:hypothetical protein